MPMLPRRAAMCRAVWPYLLELAARLSARQPAACSSCPATVQRSATAAAIRGVQPSPYRPESYNQTSGQLWSDFIAIRHHNMPVSSSLRPHLPEDALPVEVAEQQGHHMAIASQCSNVQRRLPCRPDMAPSAD